MLEGRPHIVDLIKNGEIAFIVNTTEGKQAIADSFSIRREALQQRVTYSTTVSGAQARCCIRWISATATTSTACRNCTRNWRENEHR